MKSFQEIIFCLQQYWADYGCAILQPHTVPVGAGTSHPATLLRALGKKTWRVAYVQPSRRPNDGRYGKNPNRLQEYYQFQVLIKPAPENHQELYLKSLEAVGLDLAQHDIRFVEDDWENPSLGASGLGWEVWCDGMEITQYTYFEQVGGIQCEVIPIEITYGLERLAMFLQNVDNFFEINWNGFNDEKKLTYADVGYEAEVQFSKYNFEFAGTEILFNHFHDAEIECKNLIKNELIFPAYEECLKANHLFNLLNARGVVSVTERASYILKIRNLVKLCAEEYVKFESGIA